MNEWLRDAKEYFLSIWERIKKWWNDRYGDPYQFPPDESA